MDRKLRSLVWERAGHACEYCRMPARYYDVRYHIDHIIAEQHLGLTLPENLALACFHCNTRKGPNVGGIDSASGSLAPLFNPRKDKWAEHFRWVGPRLTGLTAVGRVTIIVLAMNDPLVVAVRASLISEGIFPPADT